VQDAIWNQWVGISVVLFGSQYMWGSLMDSIFS
jgi:hypothetical protein